MVTPHPRPPERRDAMMIGQQLGPFVVESELGSGAMGTVFKARMTRDDGRVVPVALKVVSLGLLGNEGAMARFEREAAILKQLRHPHIVRLLATGRHRQTPFIAMEYVEGDSLDRVLARRGRLDWHEVVQYGQQLCDALQHAHDKGIVHRDLKPSNLMVTKGGVLKLTDFGIAKDTDVTALTGANSTIGTAAYMSPEQCRGDKTLGPKSDLYSLGVCLYELLTAKKPFVGENTVEMFLKHVNDVAVRPRRLVPDLPVWMDNLVMHLLEKGKDARPLDAATVGRMLGEIVDKVQSQQSVGAEVANARRVDRPVGVAPVAAEDREAARSLRGGPKKKRKKKPAKAAVWPKMLLFGLPLAVLLGVGGYFALAGLFRAEPADVAFRRVEQAAPDDNRAAADAFLSAHPAGPLADQARAMVRDATARRTEAVLNRRFGLAAMRANPEGFDAEAYKAAMQALDAEKGGRLAEAADLWTRVKAATPPADPATLPRPDDEQRASLAWVADRRSALIRADVPALLARLNKLIADDRIYELDRPFDPASPESVAVRALRCERQPDRPKAKATWERLAALATGPDTAAYLLRAAQRGGQFAADKETDPAARLKRVADRVAQLEAAASAADAADVPGAAKRDVRNNCRDVIDLYADEPGDDYKPLVARAEKLLKSLPK